MSESERGVMWRERKDVLHQGITPVSIKGSGTKLMVETPTLFCSGGDQL